MKNRKPSREKLKNKIQDELNRTTPDINVILGFVDEFEAENVKSIEFFRRKRMVTTRKISGALKSCIKAHGPITMILIGSAVKRIEGALLNDEKENKLEPIVGLFKKLMYLCGIWKRK